jgi:hypothetical protein
MIDVTVDLAIDIEPDHGELPFLPSEFNHNRERRVRLGWIGHNV